MKQPGNYGNEKAMKQTININIANYLFRIEDGAFEQLRNYLEEVNVRFRKLPGGHEALDDFEARMAEIFHSLMGEKDIIDNSMVEKMVGIMGSPRELEEGIGLEEGSVMEESVIRRRLYRDPDERIVAGVAGGIGSCLNVNPAWIRLIFIAATFLYGAGLLLYLALWVAVPRANNESRKRELYGSRYPGTHSHKTGYDSSDRLGSVLNEIFMVLGRFLSACFRVIIMLTGILFLLSGSLLLIGMTGAVFFNYASWLPDSMPGDSFFMRDLLRIMIYPGLQPWLYILLFIVAGLPLLALIYSGSKMIFRFRVRDRAISIVAVIIWVMASLSLTIITFNKGLSFSERASSTERINISSHSGDLYILAADTIRTDTIKKKIRPPVKESIFFYTDYEDRLYASPSISIGCSDDDPYVSITRIGHGRNRIAAFHRAEQLEYKYSFKSDTLLLMPWFSFAGDKQWMGSGLMINIMLKEGTRFMLDRNIEILVLQVKEYYNSSYNPYRGKQWWVVTGKGIVPAG